MLEEGDGPSMTSDEVADVEDEESVDVREQSPSKPSAAAADALQSSLPHTPSIEDLSTKKKPPSRIATSGLRAPTAGKSKLNFYHLIYIHSLVTVFNKKPAISLKQDKIGPRLLLISSRKLHTCF